ncbi:ImmA/IrrE family metallo-endopeptidase [Flavobacterium sp. MR2016-29]|uniref:ImmA/IrrE family metallo-endopeptidase n=1 Tax=Flavobacterium sp. MR2016-29 TaxID=2783795 RepID=UPI00188D5DCE|nr:XRE family transcriptional regulator [Flavobacterium sp. MR2016-29]MBF4493185.1 ImmA/IrrE family metallo-endopeptidase [Flavobacterium sp. MR2016-29]
MADLAYITPNILKWARESAKMTIDIAARKIPITVEQLDAFENGNLYPTISQAQKLAHLYKRPFALFFLPKIPRDFTPLQDYRKNGSLELGTGSTFIIREIQQKQNWISEVYKENGESILPFVGKFTINDNPIDVANDILKTLGISPFNYTTDNPIREWINKSERESIFVSRTSFIHSHLKLDSEELQGFAISDLYAPFVFINSDDWDAPQLFTLVHELAHIWIAETGISNDIEPSIEDKDKFHPIELFCNEVAANALMPKDLMSSLDYSTFDNSVTLLKTAKKIGVSSFALIVRALNLKIINNTEYKKLKEEADSSYRLFLKKEEEKKLRQKNATGGPNYFLLQVNRNSRLFTHTVLDAFKSGFIEPTQASNLLNVKINKFPQLEAQLYK